MKVKIIEKCEVKRFYEIEVDNEDDALNKLYSGDYEPTHCEEENNEVTFYDENDNLIEW